MKALITGINGFVGGHLSKLLLANDFKVLGIDKSDKTNVNGVDYFKLDITSKEDITRLIGKSRPDMIFHLAAISSVRVCTENKELAKKINVNGTSILLSACSESNIGPRVLVPSSAYVYGIPKYLPIDESHPMVPINEYGRLKLEQENVVKEFQNRLKVIVTRSFNHIGPNQSLGFVTSDFAKQIAEIEKGLKKPEIKVGDLTTSRDFTDVRDIVKAYLLLITKGFSGEIYNVGSGESHTIKEVLDILLSKSNMNIKVIGEKSLIRKNEVPSLICNNKKLVSLTSWKPSISLEQSLSDILAYWRKII